MTMPVEGEVLRDSDDTWSCPICGVDMSKGIDVDRAWVATAIHFAAKKDFRHRQAALFPIVEEYLDNQRETSDGE